MQMCARLVATVGNVSRIFIRLVSVIMSISFAHYLLVLWNDHERFRITLGIFVKVLEMGFVSVGSAFVMGVVGNRLGNCVLLW